MMLKIKIIKNKNNHLKKAIDYILNEQKNNGIAIGKNVSSEKNKAYEEMMFVKNKFGKINKRQGYHIILSPQKDECDDETLIKYAEKFCKKLLNDRYQAVISIHNDTKIKHAHIIFNSVSFVDGIKFQSPKDDYEKRLRPLIDNISKEMKISSIPNEKIVKKSDRNLGDKPIKKVKVSMRFLLKKDILRNILLVDSMNELFNNLEELGYQIKHRGKNVSIKVNERYIRLSSLGKEFSENNLEKYISTKTLPDIKYKYYIEKMIDTVITNGNSKIYAIDLEKYLEGYDIFTNTKIEIKERLKEIEKIANKLNNERSFNGLRRR